MGLPFFTNLATWLQLEAMDRNMLRPGSLCRLFRAGHVDPHDVFRGGGARSYLCRLAAFDRDRALLQRATMVFFIGGTLVPQLHALVLPEFFDGGLRLDVGRTNRSRNQGSIRSLQVGFAASQSCLLAAS
jgi:hypothetical protein